MSSIVATSSMTATLRDVASLAKPRLSLLVLATTAGGAWLAPGAMPAFRLALTLVSTMGVVASANAFNCWLERDSDAHMTRTATRPLAAGTLDERIALAFAFATLALSLPVLAWAANPLTALLGAIAFVSYVGIYTPLKQRSWTAMLVGAVPGALPPLMGWTAATGSVDQPGLVLFAIMFLWQIPHFIAIAIFRKDEYERAGIRVLPLVVGDRAAALHGVVYAAVLLPVSLLLTPMRVAGGLYFGVALAGGIVFLAMTLMGLRPSADVKWARSLFGISLLYLTGLFAALLLDAA